MSDYNWCHGPDCHTYTTQSRVRGSKGNKVLRTMKIKETKWNTDHTFKYFCNNNCLFGYLNKWNDSMGTSIEDEAVSSAKKYLSKNGWKKGKHG